MTQPHQRPIGIFDSGVGGLTVVRQIHRLLPREDILYLGDTARVPYGTKSPATVIRFACEDTQFLLQHRVKAVVVACNTASAWALPTLEQKFPLPVLGVVLPGAQTALLRTRNRRIGVIGTRATIRSQSYPHLIRALNPGAKVFSRACPLLVPLVEEGWTHHPVTLAVLREYLAPLLDKDIDTLILGCTHYPMLRKALASVCGASVSLVDSAAACAQFVKERLGNLGLLNSPHRRLGRIQPFVTDDAARFNELVRRFLGFPAKAARKISLPVES
jgi:glutamate racemase